MGTPDIQPSVEEGAGRPPSFTAPDGDRCTDGMRTSTRVSPGREAMPKTPPDVTARSRIEMKPSPLPSA